MQPYIIMGVVAVVLAIIGFFVGTVYRRKSAEAAIGSAEDEARSFIRSKRRNSHNASGNRKGPARTPF